MRYLQQPLLPLSTAATIALMSAASAETIVSSLTSATAEAITTEIQQVQVLRKLSIEESGTFSIKAPSNSGLQISVDGNLVLDATGTRSADVGTVATALVTLAAGDHAITVTGLSVDDAVLSTITINAAGEEAESLLVATSDLDSSQARSIQFSNTSLSTAISGTDDIVSSASLANEIFTGDAFSNSGTSSAGGSFGNGNGLVALIAGGNSSSSGGLFGGGGFLGSGENNSNAGSGFFGGGSGFFSGGGNGSSSGGGFFGGGGFLTGGGSGSNSGGGFFGGGGAFSGGGNSDSGSGGGFGGGSGGGGFGSGGSTTVDVPLPSGEETVVSPLTPPANVTLTDVIELTAAGNSLGEVANTGSTLFGAVMEGTMFDIVNVTIAPTGRETTVDIGSQTGQFAVRLFEEDFSQGAEVTVTLTAASSSDDTIVSEPVEYTFTGVAVVDGVTQALSRVAYGPTPDLYARVKSIGFEAYVEEQLDPSSINDSAYNSRNTNRLLQSTTTNQSAMFNSLMAYEIAGAAYSQRQLQHVMGDFWANHFYAATKNTSINQQNITDRAFYHDNALGNFEDMLLYTAYSPLMSQFLDNDQNRVNNINENWGREIMELYSVGVDAGYGPDDVIAVSRIYTGWNYERTNPNADNVAQVYEFDFIPNNHDTEDKYIPFLDLTIEGRDGEAGVEEGEELVSILAQHPSTRTFVCGKIVQLLVADEPPADLVTACAAAWEATSGEITPMLEAILLDPSYIETVEYQRTKVKTPFEYSVSVMRAMGADPLKLSGNDQPDDDDDSYYDRFRNTFEDAGYDILYFGIPTGLDEVGAAWTSSSVMQAMYQEMSEIAENRHNYGIDLEEEALDAGLETAEEVAAYLLTVATADRFTQTEYDALVDLLKGDDGIFDPLVENETTAFERAMGLIVVMPSFQMQ